MRVAVVVHAYHEEFWPEVARCLRNIRQPHSLIVTLSGKAGLGARILREFPLAELRPVPNIGRDVLPFVSLLPELQRFDLVCKIHTKGNHKETGWWRRRLLEGVAGNPRLVDRILGSFEERSKIVMAGSERLFRDGSRYIGENRPGMERLVGSLPERYGFFGGTMFWLRPQILADVPQLIAGEEFRPHSRRDGEPEHAIERLFGLRASERGELLLTGLSRWVGRPKLRIVTYH